MCGISGAFHFKGEPVDSGLIVAMTNAIRHRGPDGDGYFFDGPIGLGHRRLAVIDVGGGIQPMATPDQGVAVSFDGEIYNFQELRREFNKWSTVSYAISVLGVLGSQPATYGVPLGVGGPATAVWAWLVGSCMSAIIASSVAELVSAYPTAGGIYFVTKHVVPPEHVAIWGWVIGWANFLGQAAGVASLAYTIGQMVLAAASINSGTT